MRVCSKSVGWTRRAGSWGGGGGGGGDLRWAEVADLDRGGGRREVANLDRDLEVRGGDLEVGGGESVTASKISESLPPANKPAVAVGRVCAGLRRALVAIAVARARVARGTVARVGRQD